MFNTLCSVANNLGYGAMLYLFFTIIFIIKNAYVIIKVKLISSVQVPVRGTPETSPYSMFLVEHRTLKIQKKRDRTSDLGRIQ